MVEFFGRMIKLLDCKRRYNESVMCDFLSEKFLLTPGFLFVLGKYIMSVIFSNSCFFTRYYESLVKVV